MSTAKDNSQTEPDKKQNSERRPTLGRIETINLVEKNQLRAKFPIFSVGDSIRVHLKVKEGNKERVQVFEGVVIRRRGGSGVNGSFTVRKISYNIGVERTLPLHSPLIEKVEVVSTGKVRRARLYYLRGLRGKSARIRGQLVGAVVGTDQTQTDTVSDKSGSEAATAL